MQNSSILPCSAKKRGFNAMPGCVIPFAACLGRAWRVLGTGFSFALFGVGGLVIGLVLIPLLSVFQSNATARQTSSRQFIGRGFAIFIRIMKALGVLDYEIQGKENMRGLRGTLIIANHPSLIDVVFLVAFFPQAECVVKQAVVRNIFMRHTVLAANYISNTDPHELLTVCIERLKAGANLVLFPEGTRTDPGQTLQFRSGAAAIAMRANADILPIVIRCVPPTLRKREPWYRVPPSRPVWKFEVLKAVPSSSWVSVTTDARQAARALNGALLSLYSDKLSQAGQPVA